jgi:FkbM family methyltransferase
LLHPGDIAFDIGANVGQLTVVMAGLVGPAGWVYAFEANPQCLPLLRATLRANGARNCTVVCGAVGAQQGGTRILYSDERSGMQWVTSSLDPAWKLPDSGPTRPLETPALRLDAFCRHRDLTPDLLKIDVEGAEAEVLEGFQAHLAATKLHLIAELSSGFTQTSCAAVKSLDRLGYRLALPDPWRWITAGDFCSSRRLERTVVALHQSRCEEAGGWLPPPRPPLRSGEG